MRLGIVKSENEFSICRCSRLSLYLQNMKIVIAPDKFKGSLSAKEVADAIEDGIRSAMPCCETIKVPMADGGDGTAETLVSVLGGEWYRVEAVDPLHRPVMARYGVIGSKTAVLDIATASGIALLAPGEPNPMDTSSYGTGLIIKDAIAKGFRKFVIGIGGSATNDAAMGILSALGYRFTDSAGRNLSPCGKNLSAITHIDNSLALPQLKDCRFDILCDVDAAFYGENGAARIFAGQKGAGQREVELLDSGMQRFAGVIKAETGNDIQQQQFAGAAGGIGGGMWAMTNARLLQGIDSLLDLIDFDGIIKDADFIVTGEGAIDRQTLLGKAPFGICRKAIAADIPVIAFAGKVSDVQMLNDAGFLSVHSIAPCPMSQEDAMDSQTACRNIRQCVGQVFRTLAITKPPTP